jgi:hypothetical protein
MVGIHCWFFSIACCVWNRVAAFTGLAWSLVGYATFELSARRSGCLLRTDERARRGISGLIGRRGLGILLCSVRCGGSGVVFSLGVIA